MWRLFSDSRENKCSVINNVKHSFKVKACACYFLSNFYFSLNDSPSETMKNIFYFVEKLFLLSRYSVFYIFIFSSFFPVTHCLRQWSKKNLNIYDAIYCLNKNLITHFVWYLQKEIKSDIETLSINRKLNKECFYGKIMQKICFKKPQTPF